MDHEMSITGQLDPCFCSAGSLLNRLKRFAKIESFIAQA